MFEPGLEQLREDYLRAGCITDKLLPPWSFDVWRVYWDPELCRRTIDALDKLITPLPRIDVVAALGNSGLLMAGYLAEKRQKNVVFVTDPTTGLRAVFRKIRPDTVGQTDTNSIGGKQVLLVDSAIRTGQTIKDACLKVANHGGQVVGAIAVIRYGAWKEFSGLEALAQMDNPPPIKTVFCLSPPRDAMPPPKADWLQPPES